MYLNTFPHSLTLRSNLIKSSSREILPDVLGSACSWVHLQNDTSQRNRLFCAFRPSLLSGSVTINKTSVAPAGCASWSVFSGSGSRCPLWPVFLAACSSKNCCHENTMFSKPTALMSSSLPLPHWVFLVILLIRPFVTLVTKIATHLYPKGKDDSRGNFFCISNWLAVVFTSWINSLGSQSLCTAFFSYFKGKVSLLWGLPQLFLVCRFHTEAKSGTFCTTAEFFSLIFLFTSLGYHQMVR